MNPIVGDAEGDNVPCAHAYGSVMVGPEGCPARPGVASVPSHWGRVRASRVQPLPNDR